MSQHDEEVLFYFSREHFTFINQIFGDLTVREIIKDVFPNDLYTFQIEIINDNDEFEEGVHHILLNNQTGKIVCSVSNKYQNLNININDTLCQSYSLLTYFNIKIKKSQKQRQMDMIKMYRDILSNQEFITKLNEVIHSGNNHLWIDYTKQKKIYIKMNKKNIIDKINKVLDTWEEYGYNYFIGNGNIIK